MKTDPQLCIITALSRVMLYRYCLISFPMGYSCRRRCNIGSVANFMLFGVDLRFFLFSETAKLPQLVIKLLSVLPKVHRN